MPLDRNCPFANKKERNLLQKKHEESSLRKYDFSRKRKAPKKKQNVVEEEIKQKEAEGTPALVVGEHEIYSCPVAIMSDNRGLTGLIDLINWSSDMHTPLFDGGLINHTNYYFECYRTVIGEQRAIEAEETKRHRKEAEAGRKKGGKGKGKLGKPRAGKASRARRR
ncbi:MAG: hypothetical protein ACTSW7_01215 [Candidatus Thorarchaeota archaeon]